MNPVSVLPGQPSSSSLSPAALAALSDEEVKDGLTTWAGRIAAGEARLMAYIGEFDERRAWAAAGILSCAHWLSWRLGMGPNAAGERVRVARALRQLPATSAAFAEGRLSFTQVRAISRVATAEDEQDKLRELAKQRKAAAAGEPVAERIRVFTRYDADGDLCITIKAGAADGAVLLAAVEAARTDLSAERSDDPPQQATRGDGLLALCRAYLDQRAVAHPARARSDRSQLTVQLDPLSCWSRLPDGQFLPPGSLQLTIHDQGSVHRRPRRADRVVTGWDDEMRGTTKPSSTPTAYASPSIQSPAR